jgi:hypothetical protein
LETYAMNVITFTRESVAGGSELARLLAAVQGWESLHRAAERHWNRWGEARS